MPKQTPKDIEYPQSGLLLLLAAQQINYPKLSLSFELFHFFFRLVFLSAFGSP